MLNDSFKCTVVPFKNDSTSRRIIIAYIPNEKTADFFNIQRTQAKRANSFISFNFKFIDLFTFFLFNLK